MLYTLGLPLKGPGALIESCDLVDRVTPARGPFSQLASLTSTLFELKDRVGSLRRLSRRLRSLLCTRFGTGCREELRTLGRPRRGWPSRRLRQASPSRLGSSPTSSEVGSRRNAATKSRTFIHSATEAHTRPKGATVAPVVARRCTPDVRHSYCNVGILQGGQGTGKMAPLSSFFARGTSAFGGLTGGGGSSNSNAGAGGSGHTRSWSQPLASSTGLSSPQPPPSGTAEPPATTEEATTTTSTTTQQSSSGPVNHVESTSDVAGSTSSPGSAFPALRTATAGSSSPLAGTAASAVGHVRSHSHTISNPGSAAATSTAVPSSMRSPFDSHNGAPSSLHGLGFGDDVPLGMADSASVRRYHTLSTGSGSRLARLEKKHALANMDEHDRRLYGDETPEEPSVPELPPVPVAAQPSSGFQVVRAYKGVPGEASKGGMSGDNEALYAQATVQRNTSHPTRLQSPSQQPSRTWGPSTGRMGASIVKSDSLRRRMAGMSEGAADRSGNWRARSTLQEEGEDENVRAKPMCAPRRDPEVWLIVDRLRETLLPTRR